VSSARTLRKRLVVGKIEREREDGSERVEKDERKREEKRADGEKSFA
jgi:hypothetical protein